MLTLAFVPCPDADLDDRGGFKTRRSSISGSREDEATRSLCLRKTGNRLSFISAASVWGREYRGGWRGYVFRCSPLGIIETPSLVSQETWKRKTQRGAGGKRLSRSRSKCCDRVRLAPRVDPISRRVVTGDVRVRATTSPQLENSQPENFRREKKKMRPKLESNYRAAIYDARRGLNRHRIQKEGVAGRRSIGKRFYRWLSE